MVSRARAMRSFGGGAVRPSFLLDEAARSECAPSMRAVKDSLAAPLSAKWGKSECPRGIYWRTEQPQYA